MKTEPIDSASDACPDRRTLAQLGSSTLTPAEERQLARHLDRCTACQLWLDSRISDELTAPAKRYLPTDAEALPPALAHLVRQAEADLEDVTQRDSTTPAGSDTWIEVQPWLTTSDEDGPGKLGEYLLTGFLGRGGMGLVFRARDPNLNRDVAVKVLAPALLGAPVSRERFLREAQAVAALRHPAIVGIYDVQHQADLPYFVMEYVEGDSLDRRLEREGRLSSREVIRIAFHVAAGLAAAHKAKLIHRDIKPANVLIEKNSGRVRVMDFGLVRGSDDASLTSTGALLGTPSYMAPETISEQPQDARTDLYSLGAMMYHMLTGALPFEAATAIGTIQQIAAGQFVPVRTRLPNAPTALTDIIEKLLSRDPAHRYQSAVDLGRALRTARRHPDEPLSSSTWKQRLRSWPSIVAACILLPLVMLAANHWWPRQTASPQPRANQRETAARSGTESQDETAEDQSRNAVPDQPTLSSADDEPSEAVTNTEREPASASDAIQETAADDARTPPSRPEGTVADSGKPPTPVVPGPIVLRDAEQQIAGHAENLVDAAELVPDGGQIVLAAGSRHRVTESLLVEKTIEICSAGPAPATLVSDFDQPGPLIESTEGLTLTNLALATRPFNGDEAEETVLVVASGPRLVCSRCCFEQTDGTSVGLDGVEDCLLHECLILNGHGDAIRWDHEPGQGSLELTDCRIGSSSGFVAVGPAPAELTIRNTSILANYVIVFESDESPADTLSESRQIISGSILLATDSIIQVFAEEEITRRHFDRAFSWSGEGNTFTVPIAAITFEEDEDEEIEWLVDDLQDWRRLRSVRETGTRIVDLEAVAEALDIDLEEILDETPEAASTITRLFDRLRR